ncbi:hypothetical protein ACJJTC_019315 [Scirpophaga incertulas]
MATVTGLVTKILNKRLAKKGRLLSTWRVQRKPEPVAVTRGGVVTSEGVAVRYEEDSSRPLGPQDVYDNTQKAGEAGDEDPGPSRVPRSRRARAARAVVARPP